MIVWSDDLKQQNILFEGHDCAILYNGVAQTTIPETLRLAPGLFIS